MTIEQYAAEKGYRGNIEDLLKNSILIKNFEREYPPMKRLSLEQDISRQGYKDDSPYKNAEELIINSPSGRITMDNVSVPLQIESNTGQKTVLQPNSGTHQLEGTRFIEKPLMQNGGEKTTRELYEEKTGKVWSTAKEEGLTSGSYEDNMALRRSLLNNDVKDYSGGSFSDAFRKARNKLGVGKVFEYNSKRYTTNLREEENVKYEETVPKKKVEKTAPKTNEEPPQPSYNLRLSEENIRDMESKSTPSNETKPSSYNFNKEMGLPKFNYKVSKVEPENIVIGNEAENSERQLAIERATDPVSSATYALQANINNWKTINNNKKGFVVQGVGEENDSLPQAALDYNLRLSEENIREIKSKNLTPKETVEKIIPKELEEDFYKESGFDDNTSGNTASKINNVVSWANRFLVKKGVIAPNETKPIETKSLNSILEYDFKKEMKLPEFGSTTSKTTTKEKADKFVEISTVKGEDSDYLSYIAISEGNYFEYRPIKNIGSSKPNDKYQNVKAIAHFLLDSDVSGDTLYKHKYAQNYIDMQLKNKNIMEGSSVEVQKIPIIVKKEKDLVGITYKDVTDLTEYDKKNIVAPLRQFKYSDIDWESAEPAVGFNNSVKQLVTKNGKPTYLIFPSSIGKSSYGKFGGGSYVLFLPNSETTVDFAGSIEQLQKVSKDLAKSNNVDVKDIIIGFHDTGSFSAKPKANSKNELNFNQWSGFNHSKETGGGLAIIKD